MLQGFVILCHNDLITAMLAFMFFEKQLETVCAVGTIPPGVRFMTLLLQLKFLIIIKIIFMFLYWLIHQCAQAL